MGKTDQQLPQTTIDGVLGLLATHRSGGTPAPGKPPKGSKGLSGNSTAAPDTKDDKSEGTSAAETKKSKKTEGSKEKDKTKEDETPTSPNPASGSNGTDGKPIYTWEDYDVLKRDFQLEDAEARQVLTDLNGPPPAGFFAKPPEKTKPSEKPKKKKGSATEKDENVDEPEVKIPKRKKGGSVKSEVPEAEVEVPPAPLKRRRRKSNPEVPLGKI